MRTSAFSTSVLIYVCMFFLGKLSQAVESDAKRLEKLVALKTSSGAELIQLSTTSFQSLIEATPRTYGLIVMFSAPPVVCQPCATVSGQLTKVAAEYAKLPAKEASPKPIFFTELKLSQSDQSFLSKYYIQHVPILYFFPPGRSVYPQPLHDESPFNYPLRQLGAGANSIKQFVNQLTGSRLKVLRSNYQIPFVHTVRKLMPLILLVVAILAAVAIYTGAYKSPMLWFGIVVLVYIFSVGGGHYSWIHDVPLAVVNKEGNTEYIASGSRSQYVAEGFFVSVTCVSISVLVILIQELPSVMPNKTGQTVVGMALFFMTMVAIAALLVLYQLKMPQYLQYSELS